ncbi:MAG TPA: endonuclease MutS2, partial [Paludibacteraceae bacterium]|nr:endonuclease MutS2 [Paludibacteraceae bacterium]
MVYPQNFEQKIDFGNIRQLLKEKSISTLGKEKIDSIHFSSDFYEIIQQLDQTNEMLQILTTETNELPLSNIYDIRPSLHKIHVDGLYLSENELYCLCTNL